MRCSLAPQKGGQTRIPAPVGAAAPAYKGGGADCCAFGSKREAKDLCRGAGGRDRRDGRGEANRF